MKRARRAFARLLVFGLPVALWMVVILVYSAGERGGYTRSLFLLQHVIIGLTPGFDYKLDNGMLINMSMYQLNAAFRTLAHVFVYGVLAVLVVRFVQGGRPRLRLSSYFAAVVVSAAYMALDEWKRQQLPDRHAKPVDLFLNLAGVALVLVGTPLFFALKNWERRLNDESVPTAPTSPSPPTTAKEN